MKPSPSTLSPGRREWFREKNHIGVGHFGLAEKKTNEHLEFKTNKSNQRMLRTAQVGNEDFRFMSDSEVKLYAILISRHN